MREDAPDTGMASHSKKPKRSTLLCDRNPHPRDGLLTFIDWDPVEQKKVHYYTVVATGERVRKSMTGILGDCFDTFEPMAIIDKFYHVWKDDPNSKYYALIKHLELCQKCDDAEIQAARLAMRVH